VAEFQEINKKNSGRGEMEEESFGRSGGDPP
jgi:hypothetical protein